MLSKGRSDLSMARWHKWSIGCMMNGIETKPIAVVISLFERTNVLTADLSRSVELNLQIRFMVKPVLMLRWVKW